MKSIPIIVLTLLILLTNCKSIVNNTKNIDFKKGQVISTGHWVPAKVEEIKGLISSGPFIRLKDGSILTMVNGTKCSTSMDEGKTWDDVSFFDSNKYIIWSPVVIQTRSGVLIMAFSNGKEKANWKWNNETHDSPDAILPTYTTRSLDGGKTWQDFQKLHDDWTGMIRDIKELRDGNVVFTTMMLKHNPGRHTVLTYTTQDDGKSWIRSNIIDMGGSGNHGGVMESTLEQLKDGRLWMLLRTNMGYFWQTFSRDNGLTWSAPTGTNIEASSSPGALKRLASGRLILIWDRRYAEGKDSHPLLGGDNNLSEVPVSWQRDELSMMLSDDEGKSWTKPTVIAKNHPQIVYTPENAWDSKKWISYPFVFESKPGELWITTGHGGLKIKLNEKDFL